MKVKTRELIDVALDLAVAKCRGWDQFDEDGVPILQLDSSHMRARWGLYSPSTDWGIGGPIIQKEGICVDLMLNGEWLATCRKGENGPWMSGPTPLVAAMRCYCCAKLGNEVEIPEELLK